MPKLIRSACLTNYVEVARSIGLDPYRQLKAAGLSRACLADPDTMIRASAVGRLLEASAVRRRRSTRDCPREIR